MDNFNLMCFKGIEIQKLCQHKIGDRVYYFDGGHFNDEFILAHEHIEGEGKSFHIEVLNNTKLWLVGKEWDELTGIYIWKPYQGQLQGILKDEAIKFACGYRDRTIVALYWTFQWWFEKRAGESYIRILQDSYEKLWLACLMYMKYKKIWDEKKKVWETIK